MVALSPRLLTRRGGTGISSSRLAVTRAAAFGSSSAFDNVFDEPPGDMDEYGEELKSPGEETSAGEEHQGGGGSLTMYESDMLNTGSPMTLGLIAALTYPITWRSVSRMHLFRNRPVIPQFLAIVPPVAFLYIAGVYNCRMVMSRLVWPECIVRENGLVEHEMSSTSTERRHQ
ncbi:hypothetical protein Pmar_PMAR005005 [Perkinsus marinus ATCC 50983]|uniref:Uncharacterized protein n=1 Tax=Perkinsus marinus (strain ATCC 50983 / TXsc) TaxID=423536 RepID=C5KC50_PERM5|nr:hypothetical protein Pmar_PMAR005005 [Perkinsus marinus ATCC 50983]EER17942.1 hypothetical protein Pmar_PMAR005005 [Perkinsus marinus ATCC 50983]|eukprot:XP_002786146.1 hypothetical protein Pmar_PMAR005005 [Perkinsus marinus ATCC 50983]